MDLLEHTDAQGTRHPWEAARLTIVAGLIAKLPRAPSSLRVVDIGAGDGFAINELTRSLGFAAAVAQDSNYSDEWLEKLQGGPVQFARDLRDVGGQPYDLALFLDVIEHVEDDADLLRNGSALLAPAGFALITVPAFNSLFSAHDRVLKHYRRYSQKELLSALDRAGLTPIDSGYFFCSLLAPRVLRKVSERLLGTGASPTLGQWQCGPTLTKLLTGALTVDDSICRTARKVGLTLPGLSCYALCQKR